VSPDKDSPGLFASGLGFDELRELTAAGPPSGGCAWVTSARTSGGLVACRQLAATLHTVPHRRRLF
jgi:hypothetical protein